VAQNELPEQAKARHQFSRISDGLREALGAMDEVLWAVNPQRDTVRDFVTYICEYAQEYLGLVRKAGRVIGSGERDENKSVKTID
jgi:hypothetical protein